MGFNQSGDMSTLTGSSLKLFEKFTYPGISVSSTENNINTRLVKAWAAINRILIIWKSEQSDDIKYIFFQTAVMSTLLHGCTKWTLTNFIEKKLDGNCTRMLGAILNKSWKHHPSKQLQYGHLPPISKTIQIRRTIYTGHCWWSKDKLISELLLWTPLHRRECRTTN